MKAAGAGASASFSQTVGGVGSGIVQVVHPSRLVLRAFSFFLSFSFFIVIVYARLLNRAGVF